MEYDHLILTRFNLRIPGLTGHFSESWQERRLIQFMKYTVPSVCAQTSGSFRWLVFLDNERALSIRDQLSELDRYSFIELVFFQESCDQVGLVQQYCSETTASGRCLTTRLDSDDAIHPLFVEELQRFVSATLDLSKDLNVVYDYRNKVYYDPSAKTFFRMRSNQTTPFASMLEAKSNDLFRTGYCTEHGRLADGSVVEVCLPYERTLTMLSDDRVSVKHSPGLRNILRRKKAISRLQAVSEDEADQIRQEFSFL